MKIKIVANCEVDEDFDSSKFEILSKPNMDKLKGSIINFLSSIGHTNIMVNVGYNIGKENWDSDVRLK